MKIERRTELLENAARCFKEGYSPFCHAELVKMEVTGEECMELSEIIGSIVHTYILEELENDPVKRYIKSLLKSSLQIDKTARQAAVFGMDHADMPMSQLELAIKLTDSINQNFRFLMSFIRLDTLRRITGSEMKQDNG